MRRARGWDREWARSRLGPLPDAARMMPARGDHDLNPGWELPAPLAPAAVLVLVIERSGAPVILLTRRTDTLRAHPGQVSFPGGRLDPRDADPIACALREAEEEVGLAPDRVDVLGGLDVYAVRTGYAVAPVVAAASPPLALAPSTGEVAEIIEVPLASVLDPGRFRIRTREHLGRERRFYALEHDGAVIWGATAGMLHNLCDALGEYRRGRGASKK